ncbi:MAG: hypothetical protein K2G44_04950 [Clostridia bacterium]|nr:hypothetical protein [Clostridia bacterium]
METFKAIMYVFWTFIKDIWGKFCLGLMGALMILSIVLGIGWRVTGEADISKWGIWPDMEQTQDVGGDYE